MEIEVPNRAKSLCSKGHWLLATKEAAGTLQKYQSGRMLERHTLAAADY